MTLDFACEARGQLNQPQALWLCISARKLLAHMEGALNTEAQRRLLSHNTARFFDLVTSSLGMYA
jgi:hypothetical protein